MGPAAISVLELRNFPRMTANMYQSDTQTHVLTHLNTLVNWPEFIGFTL